MPLHLLLWLRSLAHQIMLVCIECKPEASAGQPPPASWRHGLAPRREGPPADGGDPQGIHAGLWVVVLLLDHAAVHHIHHAVHCGGGGGGSGRGGLSSVWMAGWSGWVWGLPGLQLAAWHATACSPDAMRTTCSPGVRMCKSLNWWGRMCCGLSAQACAACRPRCNAGQATFKAAHLHASEATTTTTTLCPLTCDGSLCNVGGHDAAANALWRRGKDARLWARQGFRGNIESCMTHAKWLRKQMAHEAGCQAGAACCRPVSSAIPLQTPARAKLCCPAPTAMPASPVAARHRWAAPAGRRRRQAAWSVLERREQGRRR